MFNIQRKYAILICVVVLVILGNKPSLSAQIEDFGMEDEIFLAYNMAFNNMDKGHVNYKNLSPEEKARLNKKIEAWKSLPPEKQKELREKMKELEQMPPEARKLYQQRFKQWKKLPTAERDHIRKKLENWNRLSNEEKESVRRRFRD